MEFTVSPSLSLPAETLSSSPAPTLINPSSRNPTSPDPSSNFGSLPLSSQLPSRLRLPTGSLRPFVITAKAGVQQEDIVTFEQRLENMVVPEKVIRSRDNWRIASYANATISWLVSLYPDQVDHLFTDPVVEHIEVDSVLTHPVLHDGDDNQHRFTSEHVKRTVRARRSKIYELVQLSTPPATPTLPDRYILDGSAGSGITVYILDSAFHTDHVEFSGTWRFVRRIPVLDRFNRPSHEPIDHADCCASKAVGVNLGAAPRANAVFIDMATRYQTTLVDAYWVAFRDIKVNHLEGKAVLTSSVGFTVTEQEWAERNKGLVNELETVLGLLVAADVPVVLAAGNGVPNSHIDHVPQLLADKLPLINVGAVDKNGDLYDESQGGPLLATNAGGVGSTCASRNSQHRWKVKSGTSLAASLVAGMAAYWLGRPGTFPQLKNRGTVAQTMKDLIISYSYPRKANGPLAAWNAEHIGDTND